MTKHEMDDWFEFDITVKAEIEPGSREYIPPYNRPELYDPGSKTEASNVRVFIGSIDITSELTSDQLQYFTDRIERDFDENA